MNQDIQMKRKLILLRMINLCFGASQAIYSQRVLMMQTHGMNATQCGLVLCISGIIGALSPLVGGAIADKLRSRYKVFMVTLAGSALVMMLVPTTAGIKLLGSSLLLFTLPMYQVFMPIGYNMVEASSINATYMVKDIDYSRLRLWMSVGNSMTNMLYTPLVSHTNVNTPFYFCLIFFVLLYMLRKTYKDFEYLPEAFTSGISNAPRQKLDFSRLIKSYYLMAFAVLNIFFTAPISTNAFLSYLLDALSIDGSRIGMVAAIRVMGEVVILSALPLLKRYMSIPMLQVLSGLMQCAELLLYRYCHSVVSVSLVNMLGGMGFGIALGTAVLYLRMLAPKGLEATANSLWSATQSFSSVVVMYVAGVLIDASGIYTVFSVMCVVGVAWVVLFILSYPIGKYVLKIEPPIPFFQARVHIHGVFH